MPPRTGDAQQRAACEAWGWAIYLIRVAKWVARLMFFLVSVSTDALAPVINRLLEQGIPVVTYNTDNPNSNRLAFAGQDLKKSGYDAAKTLAELHRGLEERRELIRTGAFEKMMAAAKAAMEASDA